MPYCFYSIPDTTDIASGSLIWSCTVPEWVVRPSESGFCCKLWVTTQDQGTLSARIDEDCDVSFSLDIFAEWFDIEENSNSEISVFPNPANGKLLIEGIEADEVQIYNAHGQLVKTVRGMNEIDVSGLVDGVYLLHITDVNGRSHVTRVMVKE